MACSFDEEDLPDSRGPCLLIPTAGPKGHGSLAGGTTEGCRSPCLIPRLGLVNSQMWLSPAGVWSQAEQQPSSIMSGQKLMARLLQSLSRPGCLAKLTSTNSWTDLQTLLGKLLAQKLAETEDYCNCWNYGRQKKSMWDHVDPGAGADAAWDCEVLWLPAGVG